MHYDVFISSKSQDNCLAEELYFFLKEKGLSVFVASKELDKIGEAQYADAIDAALDATKHMIVVASSVDNINSRWVHYEWSTFSNDLRSGFREGNLVTVLKNVPISVLPPALRHQQSFLFESIRDGRLLNYLRPSPLSSQDLTIGPRSTTNSQNSSNQLKKTIDSFVCPSDVMLRCSMGTDLAKLTILPTHERQQCGKFVANISDHESMVNLAPFGLCRSVLYPATASATTANKGIPTPMPCIPNTPTPWMDGNIDYLVEGQPALRMKSKCYCKWGGIIGLVANDFIVTLSIDGTRFEEVVVKVTDPCKTIREQVRSIIQVFELPEMDNEGNPIQYLLGRIIDGDEEPKILEFEDVAGREQCLLDYNVQPGDHLHLVSAPVAGGSKIKYTDADNTKNRLLKRIFIQNKFWRRK